MNIRLKLLAPLLVLACLPPRAGAQTADFTTLVEAAKKEGELTLIAASRDWCGVGELIDSFKAKYGLRINELNPDATSGEQVEAIKANKGNTSAQAPDTINVGLSFGPLAAAEGLIQPYKVSNWASIAPKFKDETGHWTGTYFGALTFAVNADLIKNPPQDWQDLFRAEYRNAVALTGDPRSSSQALQAVIGAGASITRGELGQAGAAGLEFFGKLKSTGNFVPVAAKTASLAQGTTPIVIRWDYLALMDRDTLKGNPPVQVIVPRTGVIGGVYVQAISAYAPHPNAAKLWVEHIFSDEGQLTMLKGYCHPVRFKPLLDAGKIPADLLTKLPSPEGYDNVIVPTVAEGEALKDMITKGWGGVSAITPK